MKIPKKLKVAGHWYDIEWDDNRLTNEGLVGLSIHNKLRIYLCKKYRGEQLANTIIEETFIHELLHCVDTNYNGHSLSEEAVDRLSEGLYQVLKDNFNL